MSTSGAAISSATSAKARDPPVAADGFFGTGQAGVGDADDLEALGQRTQGGEKSRVRGSKVREASKITVYASTVRNRPHLGVSH
jgi:hypothetical protein